jgi:hypothetical protein
MSLAKQQRYESKKLRDYANGAPCMECNAHTDTVVAAHYTGQYQHLFGKGYGIKCNDSYAAYLCDKCHTEFDQYRTGKSATEASERFLCAIARTHHYLLVNGFMVVK